MTATCLLGLGTTVDDQHSRRDEMTSGVPEGQAKPKHDSQSPVLYHCRILTSTRKNRTGPVGIDASSSINRNQCRFILFLSFSRCFFEPPLELALAIGSSIMFVADRLLCFQVMDLQCPSSWWQLRRRLGHQQSSASLLSSRDLSASRKMSLLFVLYNPH